MTYCDAFVGRLKGDFDWNDPGAELELGGIQFLTPSLMDEGLFYTVLQRAKLGPARYLDWGSVAVPVTKGEILTLLAKWEPGLDLPGPGDENHKPKQSRARSLAIVRALAPDMTYLLITEEF